MQKRLLAVYDLSCQPYSIGDMIMFQGVVLALAAHYQLPRIDLACVLNLNRTPLDPVFARRINPDNALHNLLKILPVAQFNPNLGSVFIWETETELGAFLAGNEYTLVWPPPGSRDYFHYIGMHMLANYHRTYHNIPGLMAPASFLEWGRAFYARHVLPHIPITVNIRNNPGFGQDRNSAMAEWLALFDYCAGRYPVKFVIICGLTEVDPRLRGLPNVIVAKDHRTSLAQDITLISLAAAHLGTASGPSGIAMVGHRQIPMALFNADCRPNMAHYGAAMVAAEQYVRFAFCPPPQRSWFSVETLPLLIQEFERIWADINPQQ
jgi:hypothetical protein